MKTHALKLLTFIALTVWLSAGTVRSSLFGADVIRTNRIYSYGFQDNGYVYYLCEKKVFRDKKEFRFIISVSRPEKVISRDIALFRYDTIRKKNEKLAEVMTDRNVPVNIQYSLFKKSGKLIVFAFLKRDKNNKMERSALDLFIWNGQRSALKAVTAGKERKYYEAYFSDFTFPFEKNRNIVTIDVLTNVYLKNTALYR